MSAAGFASDDKVRLSGDSMTGPLTLLGTPPLVIPAGAFAGYVATADASGNVSWAPPGTVPVSALLNIDGGSAASVAGLSNIDGGSAASAGTPVDGGTA